VPQEKAAESGGEESTVGRGASSVTMAASAARLAVAAIEASVPCCAHCGQQGVAFKRCSLCKEASYCGAECQKAGWRRHRKTCAPPLSLHQVWENLKAAEATGDWRGVLKVEGRMEELLKRQTDAGCNWTLTAFVKANELGRESTGSSEHARSVIQLEERRVEILGKMQHFRDQGGALCTIADRFFLLGRTRDAATYFNRARDLGAAHGFFSIECRACLGLASLAMFEERHEEALELYRNALAAAPLNEEDTTSYERTALNHLTRALVVTHGLDELEPLVPRYRDAAKAETRRRGCLCYDELQSLLSAAQFHEVLCTPCFEPLHICQTLASRQDR
jgi:hypothetical protein